MEICSSRCPPRSATSSWGSLACPITSLSLSRRASAACTTLQFLYASHNRLKSLPATIGNAHELERIDVSDNDLIDLPDSMRDLSKLHTLDVSSNQIGCLAYRLSLPSCPSCVRSMRRGNKLSDLPESWGSKTCADTALLLAVYVADPSRASDPQRPAQRAVWIAGERRTTSSQLCRQA
jgi:hypothetical protein